MSELVTGNETIFPTPDEGKLIAVLLFVQCYNVPGLFPLKMMSVIESP